MSRHCRGCSSSAALERLGQGAASQSTSGDAPDFVFYTGCNILKTPHIALLALDIMDALGVSYRAMGGPSHCCGVMQLRTGDVEMSGRMGTNSIEKMSHSKSGVLSWCPSCQVQFNETTLPAIERQRGARPFEMTPFIGFLKTRLDQLKASFRERVALRVALHQHPGVPNVVNAAIEILRTVPGVELVDLKQPAIGLQSASLGVLADHKRELQHAELRAASEAGVDALVTIYHSDHRELCGHEFDWPFRIVNVLEVVGQSMGLHQSVRICRLCRLGPGGRRLDRKLRIGRQHPSPGGLGCLSCGRLPRLLGGFDFRAIPAVTNKHRENANADDGDRQRNRCETRPAHAVPIAHINHFR
jgi:heterodisulfide reductase subunit D